MSILDKVKEYNSLRSQKSLIEKRMKEIGEEIKKYSIDNGTKDKNGSFYLEEGTFVFGNQVKKSIKLNQDKAKTYFSELGLLDKVIETKYEVSEDKLNTLLMEGVISEDDINNIVDVKVTNSVTVKEIEVEEEEIPVIETSTKKKVIIKKK